MRLRSRRPGYWALVGVIMIGFLIAYGVAETLHVPYLSGTPDLGVASAPTALVVVGLLVADALLPVPSSLVMVASGALFGFWVGVAVALAGNVLEFVFAYWLGYRSSPLIQKAISINEMERGNTVLRRWGVMALILTRPLPILAETTEIMAGIARLPFVKSLAAVMASSLPICGLYAWAGSHAQGFNATVFIFLALILLSAIAWRIDQGMQQKKLASLVKIRHPHQKRQIS